MRERWWNGQIKAAALYEQKNPQTDERKWINSLLRLQMQRQERESNTYGQWTAK